MNIFLIIYSPPTYFIFFSSPISHATLWTRFKCYHILANTLPSHLNFSFPIEMCHLVSMKINNYDYDHDYLRLTAGHRPISPNCLTLCNIS